jgi:hypothetical protein
MVMLVWACCPEGRKFIGWVGELEAITQSHTMCPECRHKANCLHGRITVDHQGVVPLSWLRKVDPPSAEQSIEEYDEVAA